MFRDGKTLFSRGVVEKVSYDHPKVSGLLSIGPRGMRSAFKLASYGMVDNLCPCRDNQERGLICSHLVALGLELIRQNSAGDSANKKGAERVARAVEGTRLLRVKKMTPEATKAILRIELPTTWKEEFRKGRVGLLLFLEYNGERKPISEVSTDFPLYFASRDSALLDFLERTGGGGVKSRHPISAYQFCKLLRLCRNKMLRVQETRSYPVRSEKLSLAVNMDMDRESGELNLSLSVLFPREAEDLFPLYLVSGEIAWVFNGKGFWPLESVVPESLKMLYEEPVVIRREGVPAFLMSELPLLEKALEVRTEITADLFQMKPAAPSFRLVLKGSPASLAATLYARYENEVELVAGRAAMRGNFAIPDPQDLLAYRIRNMAAEKQAVQKLESAGFLGRAGDTLRNIVGPREVLNFLGSGVPKIRRWGWKVELQGRIKPFAESAETVRLVVHVDTVESTDYFDVSYEYETGSTTLSERDIQQALRQGNSFVEFDGKTILLDADAVRQAHELFEEFSVGPGERPSSYRMKSIDGCYVESSVQALDDVNLEASSEWMEKIRRQNSQEAMENVPPSPALQGELRPYQQVGLNWLRFLEKRGFCGILADEMGLGKTLQTLAWIQLPRVDLEHQDFPALIVCPTSLVENWKEEAARFTPNLKVILLHGSTRHRRWKMLKDADIVITSYALMRRDVERHLEHTYSIVILDEAQHIKNHTTQNALAAKKLKAGHRLVLTGTPMENSVSDLWSIMDFLMPGYLGGHKEFHEHYEVPILAGGELGEYAQSKLRRKLHPFLLRRLKKDVAKDLPPKIERIAPCKLTQDQHKVYTQLLQESKQRIQEMVERDGFNKSRMEILSTLLRLRQTCCHIDLLRLEGLQSKYPSAKMDLFFELLDEALDSKHRVLVFSQFTSMLAILRKEMDQRNLEYCYLDGTTKDRQDVVRRFNRNQSIPVFLMSLKAGGTGLNLTGADMVIHFDPWWNPAVEAQATDRAHRIGQKRTVYSVKLVTKGTIEEKVVEMQRRKQDLIDAALTTDEQVIQKLSWEDVRELLSL